MGDLKQSVIVDLAGNLVRNAQRYGQALGGFSASGKRSLGGLKSLANSTGNALDKLGNRYTALLTGALGAGSAKGVIELDARLMQLKTDGRATADQIDLLKKSLFEVANDKNIRLNPDEILGGVEEIIAKTGDFKFAVDNIENLGIAIRATDAAGNDVGATFTNFYKGGVRDAGELLTLTSAIVEQTKSGSVTFRDIAAVGNKLFASYLSLGQTQAQAFKDMGAVAQIAIDAVGSADEATEATKGLLADLMKPEMQKLLSGSGIQVFNVVDGKKQIERLPLLLTEIYQKAGGDLTRIAGAGFGETAIKVFQGLAMEGNLEKMSQLMQLQSDGAEVIQGASDNASTAAAALTSATTSWKQLANEKLSSPIKALADFSNDINADTQKQLLAGAVVAGAGAVVAGKAYKYGRKLFPGKGAGIAGAAAGMAGGVQPVFVVNMPGAGFGGMPGAGTDIGTSAAKSGGRMSKILRGAGRFALPVAAIASAASLYSTWSSDADQNTKLKDTAGVVGGFAGGWGGAAMGAAIGTAILPGVGTAIGAALGGVGGYIAGELSASSIADALLNQEQKSNTGRSSQSRAEQRAHLKIEVSDDRIRVKSPNAENMDIDVSGSSMLAGGA